MLATLKRKIKNYLLLNEENLKTANADVWRLSVLRTTLLMGVVLTSAIVVHSTYTAYQQGLYYVMGLTIGFSVFLLATLSIGLKHVKVACGCLIFAVLAASISILFFTVDVISARYGLLLLFTLPIILRVLCGVKAAISAMIFNIIPFYFLLTDVQFAPLFGIDLTLPDTHTYLTSLIFLFFNFCIPMAVLRVMSSLEKQSEQNLLQSKKLSQLVNRYQEIFNNGGTPSFFCDESGRILQANRSARMLIKKYHPSCRYLQELFTLSLPVMNGVNQHATIKQAPDREYKIHSATLEHHKRQLIHCYDVSANKKSLRQFDAFKKQQYEKLYINELTQLKNHLFWRKSQTKDSTLGRHVVLLKLANLRDINLQYGFNQGDQLLLNASALLQRELSSDVTLYHFPGAKFLFTLPDTQIPQHRLNEWLHRRLPTTVEFTVPNGHISHALQWRAGHYHVHRPLSPEAVAERCAIALSQTSEWSPLVSFNIDTIKNIRVNTQQRDRIKHLLDTDQLTLYLQPQVAIEGNVVGYEVLARLKDPTSGEILQPYQFLSIVEDNKWEVLFTQKVVDGAVNMIENWPTALPRVPLAINLSGPELLSDLFYEKLLRRFSESPSLRTQLKLELTETSVLASHDETKRRLSSLASLGATIIIDDFGTGHASLSQLIDISATIIKVDREFVDSVETSERHRKIVKMTLDLAKSLDMQTIAEGVETQAQLQVLKEMGFVMFQGYLFGKPAPLENWVKLVKVQA
ncbi:GGDEF domain-containing phosphodiesterase [Alteromonas sp. D210916BOD_24]|uniref:EAL domain-containing protein n=1 Tax=Alteromonas sp. D210916BOD_24 TaxID=3157618 RepID=UPI00399D23CB